MDTDRKRFPRKEHTGRYWVALWSLVAGLVAGPVTASASQGQATESAGTEARGEQPVQPDKAKAYYHYSLGHLYQERGTLFRRPELLTQAIDELRLALQYDPTSSFLSVELADLYAATGRWRSALQEMEDAVERNPQDPAARRLLGRLYLRLLSGNWRGQVPPELQQRAVQQFEEIIRNDPSDVESYLVLAQLYRAAQDNAKAEEILKKALDLQPGSQDANTQLALFYMDIGDYRAAVRLLERAVAAGSPEPQLLATLAYAEEQMRDYKAAANAYRRALALDPDNLAYRKALGQALVYTQQYNEALEQFEVAVEANPRDPEPHLRLSQIYRIQGNFAPARESLAKAAELSPDNVEVQYNGVLLAESEGKFAEAIRSVERILGTTAKGDASQYAAQEKANRGIFLEKLGFLHRDQGDFEAAEIAFDQMRELGGDSAIRGNVRLIETYQENREYERALEASEEALKRYPDNRELAMTKASLLGSLGEAEAAVALLKPLLKNEADDREIWVALSQVYLRGKQFGPAQEAVTQAGEYSQTEDEQAYDHFLLGSIWERQKEFQKAEEEFRKALELNPNSAMTMNYLGYMFADQGIRLDEAVRYIQKALEMDPQSAAYQDSLGWAYFRQDRLDLAEEYLRKAADRLPTDPTIRDHLGDVYYKAGRIREAQQEWKAALYEWGRLPKNEVDPDEVAKIERKLKEADIKLAQETQEPRP